MSSTENMDIRVLIKEKELKYIDVAKHMGITKQRLCDLMRKKMKQKYREQILQAIQDLSKDKYLVVMVKCLCKDCTYWMDGDCEYSLCERGEDEFCSRAITNDEYWNSEEGKRILAKCEEGEEK